MVATRSLPLVVLLALAAGGDAIAGCTSGTTPVCDDSGACFILPPQGLADGGAVEASPASDGSRASDASAE
jgi:hypothetical protein